MTPALATLAAVAQAEATYEQHRVALIFDGSDGDATQALFEELRGHGPDGELALCLFRAQKAVNRARDIQPIAGSHYATLAQGKKFWALNALPLYLRLSYASKVALRYAPPIVWGWRPAEDGDPHYPWILTLDLPQGQVSFRSARRTGWPCTHASKRHCPCQSDGPDYPGKWDRVKGMNTRRILAFVNAVLHPAAMVDSTP